MNRSVSSNKNGFIGRLMGDPKPLIYFVVVLYSLTRALPATLVDEFKGSVTLLWIIDVGTVLPYVWGVIEMFAGKNIKRKLVGAIVAIPSFLAPYVYWYSQGEDYPWFVNVVIACFIVAAIAVELVKRIKLKATSNRRHHLRHIA